MRPTFYRDNQVYVFAIFSSILLSLLIGYRNSVINPDGICYILSAQMLGSASIKEVLQLCPQSKWPFYSTLIYALGQITHLSYNVSAHLLNGVLSLVSVLTFVKIVESLGANQRVMWLAALVILFDHQFNILRDNIIRDHGFWAFYLISIYLLLNYFREPKWYTALSWSMSLLIATLFRIEGAVFLIAMPFVSFLYLKEPMLKRAKAFVNLNAVLVLLYFCYLIWQFFQPEHTRGLGRVDELIHQFKNGLFILADRFHDVRGALVSYVLPGEATSDAGAIVILAWISWFLYNVMISLSWCYTLVLAYALKSRSLVLSSNNAPVIWAYLIINLLMTLAFLAENLFISKRYLIALTFVLMLWLPFAVNDLIVKWQSLRHRLFLILITVFFFASALGGGSRIWPLQILHTYSR